MMSTTHVSLTPKFKFFHFLIYCFLFFIIIYLGKNPEQIRQTFNIKNDFTPAEEEAVRAENKWAEES